MPSPTTAADLLADPLLRDVPVLEGHKVLAGVALYAKVGQGGMGVVYRGRHCLLDIDMAVKVLKPSLVAEDERFALRFRREAQVAAHITHQNVVRLYEANQQSGLHYLLMEFVDGESARDRVPRKGRLPVQEALGILLGAAAGVAEAHRADVVHRDLKPDNVLIARDGRVKVADLGLVKRDGGSGDSVTLGSAIMGTPQYMAPEQWESPDVTPTADVWALGATLWFLLVGEHAIEGKSLAAMARRVQEQDFPSLRQARPDLPVAVYELFERCVARAPAERFADARALVEALLPLVRGGEEQLADPEAGLGGSGPSLPTPPPRATIERIRDALGTDTALAGTGVRRSEAQTIVSKGRTEVSTAPGDPIDIALHGDGRRRRGRARRWLVLAAVPFLLLLGVAMWFDPSREMVLGWFGASRRQRAQALVQAGDEAKRAGRLDEAIANFEAAIAVDWIGVDEQQLTAALLERAEASLAKDPLQQAHAEGALLDSRRAVELRSGDPKAAALKARAEKNLQQALTAALLVDRPTANEVGESRNFRVFGRFAWTGLVDVEVRGPNGEGLLTNVTQYPVLGSTGRFVAGSLLAQVGPWRPTLRCKGRFGDVRIAMPWPVFLAGVFCELDKRDWRTDTEAMAKTHVWNRAGIVMVPIPERTFTMGSMQFATDRKDDEFQHSVTLTAPFWLGRTEVTRAQWMRLMKTSPWLDRLDTDPGDEPATRITHAMANEFCAELTKLEFEAKRLPLGYRYCLPSEAQWELAAHGGAYRHYVHGDKPAGLEQHAVFGEKVRFAAPVATKKANAFGLFDLAGNADEWCEDLALAKDGLVTTLTYQEGVTDPLGNVGSLCIHRGGNSRSPAAECRNSARFAAPPDTARDTLGFRVALAKRAP